MLTAIGGLGRAFALGRAEPEPMSPVTGRLPAGRYIKKGLFVFERQAVGGGHTRFASDQHPDRIARGLEHEVGARGHAIPIGDRLGQRHLELAGHF